jgi:hypothetical protein
VADVHRLASTKTHYGAGIDTNDNVVLFARHVDSFDDVAFVLSFPTAQAAAAALAEWGRLIAPFLDTEPF